jgi:deoxyribodipyrimidine photo-lyase
MQGDPAENLPKLVADTGAGLLVNDYSPLKLGRKWKDEVGPASRSGGAAVGSSPT